MLLISLPVHSPCRFSPKKRSHEHNMNNADNSVFFLILLREMQCPLNQLRTRTEWQKIIIKLQTGFLFALKIFIFPAILKFLNNVSSLSRKLYVISRPFNITIAVVQLTSLRHFRNYPQANSHQVGISFIACCFTRSSYRCFPWLKRKTNYK